MYVIAEKQISQLILFIHASSYILTQEQQAKCWGHSNTVHVVHINTGDMGYYTTKQIRIQKPMKGMSKPMFTLPNGRHGDLKWIACSNFTWSQYSDEMNILLDCQC